MYYPTDHQHEEEDRSIAAFAMTPAIQRRCNALIALHALHFSGHAAVAITQDQLLLNLVSRQIRLLFPADVRRSEGSRISDTRPSWRSTSIDLANHSPPQPKPQPTTAHTTAKQTAKQEPPTPAKTHTTQTTRKEQPGATP